MKVKQEQYPIAYLVAQRYSLTLGKLKSLINMCNQNARLEYYDADHDLKYVRIHKLKRELGLK